MVHRLQRDGSDVTIPVLRWRCCNPFIRTAHCTRSLITVWTSALNRLFIHVGEGSTGPIPFARSRWQRNHNKTSPSLQTVKIILRILLCQPCYARLRQNDAQQHPARYRVGTYCADSPSWLSALSWFMLPFDVDAANELRHVRDSIEIDGVI